MQRVVILGGAGNLAGVAARRLRESCPGVSIVLADRDLEKAARRAHALGPLCSAERVDLFDASRLRAVLEGASLVINATGPYFRTGGPVLEAAIDVRANYVDFGDDVESAERMLALDGLARQTGITALIGAGIAPGVVNVAARHLASRLESPDSVQIAWVTGASQTPPGGERGGRAVVEHMLHSCIGTTFRIVDGRRLVIPAFRSSELVEFPAPLGRCRVYDIGHAELATIPHFLPGIRNVRTQGAIRPNALNGLFQGLAAAVASGAVEWEAAVDFLMALESGEPLASAPLRAGLAGILRQTFRAELGLSDLREAFGLMRASGNPETEGGIYIRVEGASNGKRVALTSRTAMRQTSERGGMDDVTGTPLAAFATLMLSGGIARPGVLAPEAIEDSSEFLSILASMGYPALDGIRDPETVVLGPMRG